MTPLEEAIREQLRNFGGDKSATWRAIAKRWLSDDTFRAAVEQEVLDQIGYPIGGELSAIVDEAIEAHANPFHIEQMIVEAMDTVENPTGGGEAEADIFRAGARAIQRMTYRIAEELGPEM